MSSGTPRTEAESLSRTVFLITIAGVAAFGLSVIVYVLS